MILQEKTAQEDIKAIELMASQTHISPVEDIDLEAGTTESGSGGSGPAQPVYSQAIFLSLSTSPVGNTEEACPGESPCAHFRFLPWLSEEGTPRSEG